MLLLTGDKVEMELSLVTGRQQYRCIVPKLYIQSKVLLKMGEFVTQKHVEQIQIDK